MSKTALVFPGQGAQSVGMGLDLYNGLESAKAVFDLADRTLGFSLSELCFNGPEDRLKETANAQPAIVSVSLAIYETIKGSGHLPEVSYVAGHSLGEYTALHACGALSLKDTIFLARKRGEAMQKAAAQSAGGMAAVLGLDEAALALITADTGVYIANYNSPGQLVISGEKERLEKAGEAAMAKGAAKVVSLAVSGAFHTPLMSPALVDLKKSIESLRFGKPEIPLVANSSAQPVTTASGISDELMTQLTHSVRWQASIEMMIADGVDTFIEIGPGKVLSGLIKRINRGVKTVAISDLASLKAFIGG